MSEREEKTEQDERKETDIRKCLRYEENQTDDGKEGNIEGTIRR